jgi:mannose-6-phosphate isomerase-like protein (cupin superfamily)
VARKSVIEGEEDSSFGSDTSDNDVGENENATPRRNETVAPLAKNSDVAEVGNTIRGNAIEVADSEDDEESRGAVDSTLHALANNSSSDAMHFESNNGGDGDESMSQPGQSVLGSDDGRAVEDSEPEIYNDDDGDVVETSFGHANDEENNADDEDPLRSRSAVSQEQEFDHLHGPADVASSPNDSMARSLLSDFTPATRRSVPNMSTPASVTPLKPRKGANQASRRPSSLYFSEGTSRLSHASNSRMSMAGMSTVMTDFGPDFGGESYHDGDGTLFANESEMTGNMTTISDEEPLTPRGAAAMAEDEHNKGLRRSQRNRIAPLKFWENEHIVYHLDESDMPAMVDVVHAIPQPTPKRRRIVKKGPRKKQRRVDLEEEKDDIVIDQPHAVEGQVFQFPDMDKKMDRLLALSRDSMEFKREGEQHSVAILFDEDWEFTATGVMRIDPGGSRPMKPSRRNSYVFYVISGAVEVNISDNIFQIGRGGAFDVPRGNFYSIANLYDKDSLLFFVQTTDTLSNQELKNAEGRLSTGSGSNNAARETPIVTAN